MSTSNCQRNKAYDTRTIREWNSILVSACSSMDICNEAPRISDQQLEFQNSNSTLSILSNHEHSYSFPYKTTNSAAMTSYPNKKEISIPPLDLNNKVGTVERLIIFALRYYGCGWQIMSEVLFQYGFSNNMESIMAFLKENKIITHSELSHPEQGRSLHTFETSGAPITVAIDYQNGNPVAVDIKCSDLPVVHSLAGGRVRTDDRIISTYVSAGRIVCWVPYSVPCPS